MSSEDLGQVPEVTGIGVGGPGGPQQTDLAGFLVRLGSEARDRMRRGRRDPRVKV